MTEEEKRKTTIIPGELITSTLQVGVAIQKVKNSTKDLTPEQLQYLIKQLELEKDKK